MRLVNDIEILREMLVPDIQIPLQQGRGRPSVELKDAQGGTTVAIKGIPHDAIVIRADDFEAPLAVFRGEKGERKRADFVIVSSDEKGRWIIFIETQRGNYKKPSEVVEQLKGAQCFISYCKCIGKSFWKVEEFLDGYQYRFVSIAGLSLEKQGTGSYSPPIQSKGELHDTPDAFLKIFGSPNLYFRHLTQVPN